MQLTTKCKILVVEDHEDTRVLIAIVLEPDYEVITAMSIAGALALIQTHAFDLIVLDSLLIDGTGIELCKRIRETDYSTPILFYSALAYEKDKNEAFDSGAQGYLVKPAAIPALCQAVADLVTPCQSQTRARHRKGLRRAGQTMGAGVVRSFPR